MSLSSNILIVEDEPAIAELLAMNLQHAGHCPIRAGSAEEALRVIRDVLPDVLLIDWMLPGMSGVALARALRTDARTKAIPIIMLTARSEEGDKVQGLDAGADDYITKPFDVEELRLRVKNAIARATYESLTNPTTGLPSARLIEDQLRRLLRRDNWGIIYIGIDHLEPFKEVYGFVAADEVLRYTAMVLGETADRIGTPEDFIGHIGGDDFLVITRKELIRPMVQDMTRRFSEGIVTHYDFKTRQQGYLVIRDDQGNEQRVGLMELAIGAISSDDGPFTDIREITEAAAAARRERRLP